MIKKRTLIAVALCAIFATNSSFAKTSADNIAKLGVELTPIGAEKAGNADGSIPAWDGGIKSAPAGYTLGMHHPDPFATDAVKFTIDKSNLDKYKAQLSPGQLALFDTYPDTFKMNIYRHAAVRRILNLFMMRLRNMPQMRN